MRSAASAGHGSTEIQTVIAWHEALNSGDVDGLLNLSHPEVEVGGPRGTAHGAQNLRDWASRAGIHLNPGRIFYGSDTVVVEQEATWTQADTAETTPVQTVASTFVVRDGLLTSVVRYPDLAEALRAADLDERYAVE